MWARSEGVESGVTGSARRAVGGSNFSFDMRPVLQDSPHKALDASRGNTPGPYRCGSGRERTSVGHQNQGPRMRRMHGTTNERTISVSSSTPMHAVVPT